MLALTLVCFALVHLAPGDPLVLTLPPDASGERQAQWRTLYGFDRSYPEQFAAWVWRALQGDPGTRIASGRAEVDEVLRAVVNTQRLAVCATAIGFDFGCLFGCLFGFVAGYFQNSWLDRLARTVPSLHDGVVEEPCARRAARNDWRRAARPVGTAAGLRFCRPLRLRHRHLHQTRPELVML